MADHAINFIRVYGFTTADKNEKTAKSMDHVILNLVKLSAYVPILGLITQIGLAVLAYTGNNQLEGPGKFAFITRAALSPVFPVLAPLDFVGSIMYQVMKSKNKGVNPLK